MKPFRQRWVTYLQKFRPPRTLKITPAGRAFIGITIGVGIAALNTNNNLLYLILGALLSAIVVSGILSEQCIQRLEIHRLGSVAPFAQEVFAYRYGIRAKGAPAFALVVEEVASEIQSSAKVAYIPKGQTAVVRANMFASRRGPFLLNSIKVTTVFPLGLFAKSRQIDVSETLWVFPKRIDCMETVTNTDRHQHIEGASRILKDGVGDILGLRELQPTEDARRINWKKSASVGKLLTTEREREGRRRYVFHIDEVDTKHLDAVCERAAAQAHNLLEAGFEVGLVSDSCQLRPSSGPLQEHRILSALATLGFEE